MNIKCALFLRDFEICYVNVPVDSCDNWNYKFRFLDSSLLVIVLADISTPEVCMETCSWITLGTYTQCILRLVLVSWPMAGIIILDWRGFKWEPELQYSSGQKSLCTGTFLHKCQPGIPDTIFTIPLSRSLLTSWGCCLTPDFDLRKRCASSRHLRRRFEKSSLPSYLSPYKYLGCRNSAQGLLVAEKSQIWTQTRKTDNPRCRWLIARRRPTA